MRSRPSARRATRWDCQILSNRVWGMWAFSAISLPCGEIDYYAAARQRRRGSTMARISYFEERDHPEIAALIDKIKAGRRGGLLNVYKLLLHAPALAETWLDHVGAVRWKTG